MNSKSDGQFYSGRITNDEHKLVFRCSECPFEDQDKCKVKMFKCKFAPDYKDFGSIR